MNTNKMKSYLYKSENFIIIGLILGIVFGIFFIHLSRDTSLDYNVWLSAGKQDNYTLNSYVRFKYTHPDRYIEGRWLIKQVACREGDLLERYGDYFTCNGKNIVKALHIDKNDNPLIQFEYNGIIPKGYYFLTGTHERSYDSRYFGLIYHSEIDERVFPLRSLLW